MRRDEILNAGLALEELVRVRVGCGPRGGPEVDNSPLALAVEDCGGVGSGGAAGDSGAERFGPRPAPGRPGTGRPEAMSWSQLRGGSRSWPSPGLSPAANGQQPPPRAPLAWSCGKARRRALWDCMTQTHSCTACCPVAAWNTNVVLPYKEREDGCLLPKPLSWILLVSAAAWHLVSLALIPGSTTGLCLAESSSVGKSRKRLSTRPSTSHGKAWLVVHKCLELRDKYSGRSGLGER